VLLLPILHINDLYYLSNNEIGVGQRYFNGKTPPHITTLIIATSTGALAINVHLPSLPGMAVYFDTSYSSVQLTLSLYLVASALLQLLIGPLSDYFGRRPVMIVCFAIFVISTLGAIFATSIEALLAWRILQATAVAGQVLSRAIVRDTVDADATASKIGYVTMGTALAPMAGPVAGGMLDELYGWQATFALMFGFGMLALAVTWFDLGETKTRAAGDTLRAQLRSYPELLQSGRFWGFTLTALFTAGAFFAFLGGGPLVATELLGMTPLDYGLHFVIVLVGYMIGNFFSGRYAQRMGVNAMMVSGNVIVVVALVLALWLLHIDNPSAAGLFGPMALVGIGNGLTLPSANSGIVSVRPNLAGSASGLGGALQIGGAAALAWIAVALTTVETGAAPLFWVMLLSAVGALLASLYVIHVEKAGRRTS